MAIVPGSGSAETAHQIIEDDGPKDTPHEPQDQEDFLDEEPLEEAELDDTLLEEDAQDEDALEEVELEEAGA